tara:strand:+ start:2320 stop:3045 length:726 start_codon:yes stop_codon:yes gene_type:complete
MALHAIFKETPVKFSSDYTFRVRTGQVANGRPMSLKNIRFTTGDNEVADSVATLYGGKRQEWETKSEEIYEVLSEVPSISIILETISSEYVLWGRANAPIRTCNGQTQADDKQSPCACATMVDDLAGWKAAAKQGTACAPTVKLTFALAENPDIGLGRFQSSSWGLAMGDPDWKKDKLTDGEIWQPPISDLETQLAEYGGRAMATLAIVPVDYETKAGRNVSYSKPVLTLTGPAPEEEGAF